MPKHHVAINQPPMGKLSSSCHPPLPSRKHPHEPPQEHILALLHPLLDVIGKGSHIHLPSAGLSLSFDLAAPLLANCSGFSNSCRRIEFRSGIDVCQMFRHGRFGHIKQVGDRLFGMLAKMAKADGMV